MEKMIVDSNMKKVIMICGESYLKKVDDRSCCIGKEDQIMTREIYEKADINKFVTVLEEKMMIKRHIS